MTFAVIWIVILPVFLWPNWLRFEIASVQDHGFIVSWKSIVTVAVIRTAIFMAILTVFLFSSDT